MTGAAPAEAGLTGRGPELDALTRHLTCDDAVLVLAGPHGVGLTALVDAAAAQATAAGHAVLRLTGARSERDLRFAGLHQLIVGLQDAIDISATEHHDTLASVIGEVDRVGADVRRITRAVASLLAGLSRQRPVVVAIDDGQWFDPCSALVLHRVAAGGNPDLTFLYATHTAPAGTAFERSPVLNVTPLDRDAAERLLRRRWPDLAPRVRSRVLATAAGLPLALVHLPTALTPGQRSGSQPLPSMLGLTHRLRLLYEPTIAALPDGARRILLQIAVGDDSTAADLVASQPARHAGLLYVDDLTDRPRLAHPLIACTVVAMATSTQLRAMHSRLAEHEPAGGMARARHLAEATYQPDEDVAAEVERAAHRARANGRADEAADGLLLAADLSTTPAMRLRRLADAAAVSVAEAGVLGIDAFWDEIVHQQARPGSSLATAYAAALHLLHAKGDAPSGQAILVEALTHQDGDNDRGQARRDEAVLLLLRLDALIASPAVRAATGQVLARIPDSPRTTMARAMWSGDARTVAGSLPSWMNTAVVSSAGSADPRPILAIASVAEDLVGVSPCAGDLARMAADGNSGGAAGAAMQAGVLLARDALLHGHLERAEDLACATAETAAQRGYLALEHIAGNIVAVVAAIRGDDEAVRRLVDRNIASGVPDNARLFASANHRALGLAALVGGRYDEAYLHFGKICSPGQLPGHDKLAVLAGLNLVEAAVRTGRSRAAQAHADALNRLPLVAVSPRLMFMAAGASAMATAGPEAADRYDHALSLPGVAGWPFERARLELSYGEWLRRQRRITQAREHLVVALELYEGLGCLPGLRQARIELQATGLTRGTGSTMSSRLTPQELAVAELVAEGLSNREIGERLQLSPRTVSAHLYKVFPKLGIRSRAAIQDALAK